MTTTHNVSLTDEKPRPKSSLSFIETRPKSSAGSMNETRQKSSAVLNETAPTPVEEKAPPPEGLRFWLTLISLMIATFCATVDVTAVSTALPTITHDLDGAEFTWVGSAYNLASTAFVPLSGGLVQIFGRKPVMLGSLAFFILGSALCGAAVSMTMLITGRTVQGVGCGGILAVKDIIIADLVPLHKRGVFMGVVALTWALGATSGPLLGGIFAQVNWRWLFYLNVPLAGLAFAAVWTFLHVHSPTHNFHTKMRMIDWGGNFLVVGATSSTIIALTWGGVRYPWDSPQVIVPLVLGILGLGVFIAYEVKVPAEPLVPGKLLRNRTSVGGYLAGFCHGTITSCVIFYLPVYFQAVKLQSPIRSGVTTLGVASLNAPGALMLGASITRFKRYRPQNAISWMVFMVGLGLLSLLRADSAKSSYIGYQILVGMGMGAIYIAPTFPVLAAVPTTDSAQALALFMFIRNFSFTWGVTIGSTLLQNGLKKRLPDVVIANLSVLGGPNVGNEIAYAIIPHIPALPTELQEQVKSAFTDSLRILWLVLLGIASLGLLSVLVIKEIEMHKTNDKKYRMKDGKRITIGGPRDIPDVDLECIAELKMIPEQDENGVEESKKDLKHGEEIGDLTPDTTAMGCEERGNVTTMEVKKNKGVRAADLEETGDVPIVDRSESDGTIAMDSKGGLQSEGTGMEITI
ncbi:hypothetical protein FRB96_002673 [Tulasnella sp. 330]|nr:hypothetical protein FRB96_002673 [Tulasnella sp. 330]